ncbi:hypothetical protein SESBI_06306 [Sesbania bispinosa]|nr:hypothetical protein SESBI_06306 [Sesbania bispinosa]
MGVNLFLFMFSDNQEAQDIFHRGPWYVMGNLLSLQRWLPQASAYELDYNKVSFWIQLHGISLDMMTAKNAAKIINRIGEVREVENPEVEGILLRTLSGAKLGVPPAKPILSVSQDQYFWRKKSHQQAEGFPMNKDKPGDKDGTYQIILGQGSGMKNTDSFSEGPCKETMTEAISVAERQHLKGKKVLEAADSLVGDKEICSHTRTAEKYNRADVGQQGDHMSPTNLAGNQGSPKVNSFQPYSNGLFSGKANRSPNKIEVTKIDLLEGKVRAGLGPEHLGLLNIHTEFIGLKKDPIILDYPSLTKDKKEKGELGYLVELPEDDDEEDQNTQYTVLQQETESELIVGWNSSLSLKRYRKDAFVDATHLFEDLWSQQKRQKMLEEGGISEPSVSQERNLLMGNSNKAGEAGQYLPHPQP